jgi:predicted nucleic acid-binding protein
VAVADTSFLVALGKDDDRFHEAARSHPKAYQGADIPAEIWFEFLWVASRVLNGRRLREIAANLLEGPYRVQPSLKPQDVAEIASEHADVNDRLARLKLGALSLYDHVVCVVAARRKDEILTFDDGIVAAVRAKLFPGARIA